MYVDIILLGTTALEQAADVYHFEYLLIFFAFRDADPAADL